MQTKKPRLVDDKPAAPVMRCGEPLWVLTETLECAVAKHCVSCCHKILAGQHDLLANSKPNVRPETCPRSTQSKDAFRDLIGLIPLRNASVLTVGDGDLSFSLALAKVVDDASLIVATTYEPKSNLAKSYPKTGLSNIAKLEKLGATVLHEINAEQLDAAQLSENVSFDTFDFVIFNFPCVAVDDSPGLDGQLKELELNQQLLQRFGSCVTSVLTPNTGQVHVTHKTKAAFQHWQVADCILKHSSQQLCSAGALVFDRCVFPGYVNRKVRDAKSFPMTDAVTFVFECCNIEEKEDKSKRDVVKLELKESLMGFVKRLRKGKVAKAPVSEQMLLLVNRELLL